MGLKEKEVRKVLGKARGIFDFFGMILYSIFSVAFLLILTLATLEEEKEIRKKAKSLSKGESQSK